MPQLDLSCLQISSRHLAMLLALLNKHVPHAEVWAYGSRVIGDAHEGSDLDLVLRNRTDPTQDVPGWVDLKESLQSSVLPMLVDVHVWSQLPESFRRHIEAAYVVVCGEGTRRL
jgi:predicted nucleotidyltransferase